MNNSSKYIWWGSHASNVTSNNWGSASSTTFGNLNANVQVSLANGVSADTLTDGNVMSAYAEFTNDELYDISLIPLGNVSTTVATYVINNVCEIRKDCLAFVSPDQAQVVGITSNSTQTTNITGFRDSLPSSSYGVMDSGFKYQFDRYNDVYRWLPLNGDVAGLCARTDQERDPWFSPAGTNRGVIRNVIKLAWNPTKSNRDVLYNRGINPVVTFQGEGTVLFGDKTLLNRPSAFDRINVRRLFLNLEVATRDTVKYFVFEPNTLFTRTQVVNTMTPIFENAKNTEGVYDYLIICDERNNTPDVIDNNELKIDIYLKPVRTAEFILVSFYATRTSQNFQELVA